MATIEQDLQNIMKLAGAIQLDADSKEQALDWEKVHAQARDIVITVFGIRKMLGLNGIEDGLTEFTAGLDEHPEGYDGICLCSSCRESGQ